MIQDLINKEYKRVSLQDTETIILLNKSQEELTAMQARIEKLEALQTIAEDMNTWLIKSKLGGTTHQRSLAEALYALKGDE